MVDRLVVTSLSSSVSVKIIWDIFGFLVVVVVVVIDQDMVTYLLITRLKDLVSCVIRFLSSLLFTIHVMIIISFD